ncbi:hypothetical protein [Archangium gephyra]|uniref:Uncharacterized protein n=1 Tax=Archangium gephyra TaxID=48 RepID=A0AAC8QBS7_9BACT|nr:hypothetical protein [Archangium gephyra]AKJ04822.1 Hypothetical protein AA314_06448 [Archangium gephyra]
MAVSPRPLLGRKAASLRRPVGGGHPRQDAKPWAMPACVNTRLPSTRGALALEHMSRAEDGRHSP